MNAISVIAVLVSTDCSVNRTSSEINSVEDGVLGDSSILVDINVMTVSGCDVLETFVLISVPVIVLLEAGDAEIGASVLSFILTLDRVSSVGSGFAGVSIVVETVSGLPLGVFSVPNLEESEMFVG
jgi:hypothetical protein